MGLFVNRVRYKGGSPTLGASSGIINNAVLNGRDFYDDDYNPSPPAHDYSQDYFTVTALESGNFQLRYFGPDIKIVKNGQDVFDWYNPNTANASAWTTIISLDPGDYVLMRKTASGPIGSAYGGFVQCTGNFEVSGNIMSLLYGDDFVGKTSFPSTSAQYFRNFFKDANKLVNAGNLILPATTLPSACYNSMFRGCTSLVTAPELPATTLKVGSYYGQYQYMFYGCTSLTTAPVLPAIIMTDYCYSYMFYGCTSLNKVICLAVQTYAYQCLDNWLNGVSATGTFVKNPNKTNWPSGANGIPTGWTVQDYAA